jgi:hypothetical protein
MVFPSTDLDIIVEVYLGANPTEAPASWPAPTDLSSRLLRQPIHIRRGRGKNQRTAQAGACTLWLDNSDGALTPLLATSAYYPDWDLGVPLRVSVDNVGASPPYVRHAGFVAAIEAVMVPGTGGRNISAVRVTSAGVLRRISQGAVVRSALRRTILASAPEAYWPLEDDADATLAGASVEGPPLRIAGTVDFAAFGDLAGAAQTPDMTAGSLFGTVSGVSATSWHAEFAVKMPFNSISVVGRIYAHSSAAAIWRIFLPTAAGGSCQVFVTDVNSSVLFNLFGTAVAASFENAWHHIAITAEQSGTSVVGKLYVDGVLEATGSGTATLGDPYEFWANHQLTTVTSMAHIAVGSGTTLSGAANALTGYSGEQAHERISRVCGEEGIPFSGTATASNECGPQPVADIVAVLQDAEAVDHGMLIEDLAFGLDYRASTQRENLSPVMTVDLSTYRTTAGTQADVLTPVRDDARIRNEWTISRPEGSSAKATDTAHIAKRGRYNDSATVNVDGDGRLLDEAQWRVHEGTFEGLRYDTIPLDIGANP